MKSIDRKSISWVAGEKTSLSLALAKRRGDRSPLKMPSFFQILAIGLYIVGCEPFRYATADDEAPQTKWVTVLTPEGLTVSVEAHPA